MIFTETSLRGAFVIDVQPRLDERGDFARTWCQQEFRDAGLDPRLVQCNTSLTQKKGTIRGLHFQRPPHAEAKLVRCTAGRIFDVIVDLRPHSATYCQHLALELDAKRRRMVYVPVGFAHGFQTLEDDCEVFYQMSHPHVPASADGVRWNDPTFAIQWPLEVRVIAERDQNFADFCPDEAVVPRSSTAEPT